MRTSLLNILGFCVSAVILVWGALIVTGVTYYNVIPGNLEFLNLPSLAIVIGGIFASVFISYPFKDVITAIGQSFRLFTYSGVTDEVLANDVSMIIEWQKRMKINKQETVNELAAQYEGEFLGYLFSILDTNYTIQELRELGEANIEESYTRQQKINTIIQSMGKSAPVFGMLGTLFGLIVILSGFDDTQALLSGLAAALMTTLYGIIIGNFIFTPMASKMNNIASLQYFREKLLLEGVLLIEQKKTTLQIYDTLQARLQRKNHQI